jgi:hypothetical protein
MDEDEILVFGFELLQIFLEYVQSRAEALGNLHLGTTGRREDYSS